jgi:hypothetical protein
MSLGKILKQFVSLEIKFITILHDENKETNVKEKIFNDRKQKNKGVTASYDAISKHFSNI